MNPQPDPHNPLQLNVVIPQHTTESREQAIKDAKVAMNKAADAVRHARGVLNKKLKAMGVKKLIRPDDLHKAIDQMERIVERGQRDVKDVFERARKELERS